MTRAYSVGDEVKWKWGAHSARGAVAAVHRRKITKIIKGADVTREASEDEPAYTIEQDDGGEVLKSHSELSRA